MTANHREGERRTWPRLEVEALIQGILAEGNLRLKLLDLTFGGFAVEGPIVFTIGSRHHFRFTTDANLVISMPATAIYTRPVGPSDGMAHHVTGFRFAPDGPDGEQAVQLLLDAAIAPLTFS